MASSSKKVQHSSQQWRDLGNEKFRAAHAAGINAYTLADRMRDALCNYQRAFHTAENDEELASAARNLGVANWKMVWLQKCTSVSVGQMQQSYKEGIRYLGKAYTMGERCKDFAWQAGVNRQLMDVINEAYAFHETFPLRQRLGPYEQYADCLPENTYKSRCYLKIAQVIFMEGITSLQNGEYKQSLDNMKECYRPIEEVKRLAGGDETLLREATILKEDCYLHTCTAESLQARTIGDDIFKKTLQEEEQILMTAVYDALDWYKKAILLTREVDVEMEAIAHSRIGVVYDKVFKRKDKAHDYFRRSVDLAASMSPRNFGTEDWFLTATAVLQRYQEEVKEQEDAEWQKKREKYVVELKKELESLDDEDFGKGDASLLRYVYKTHAPKRSDHKLELTDKELDKLSEKDMKGVLRKALIHYHPDKQKEHGEKWVVLCEEISKCLSSRYEQKKCAE